MLKSVKFEIIKDKPPLFDDIKRVFPAAVKEGILFCWGDVIYNPSGIDVPGYLIAHEAVHQKQQAGEPAFWWEKYLTDPEFRLKQEIPAHQAEYEQYSIDFPSRHMRRYAAKVIAKRLSGNLYGNMVEFKRAKRLVMMGVNINHG